jgi:hypothetical protein
MYYNLIRIFICTPMWTKFYSCKMWVLQFVPTITERSSLVTIVITRFVISTRLICCLPLNTIDEFLVSRFVNNKRVQYKDVTLLWTYYC